MKKRINRIFIFFVGLLVFFAFLLPVLGILLNNMHLFFVGMICSAMFFGFGLLLAIWLFGYLAMRGIVAYSGRYYYPDNNHVLISAKTEKALERTKKRVVAEMNQKGYVFSGGDSMNPKISENCSPYTEHVAILSFKKVGQDAILNETST